MRGRARREADTQAVRHLILVLLLVVVQAVRIILIVGVPRLKVKERQASGAIHPLAVLVGGRIARHLKLPRLGRGGPASSTTAAGQLTHRRARLRAAARREQPPLAPFHLALALTRRLVALIRAAAVVLPTLAAPVAAASRVVIPRLAGQRLAGQRLAGRLAARRFARRPPRLMAMRTTRAVMAVAASTAVGVAVVAGRRLRLLLAPPAPSPPAMLPGVFVASAATALCMAVARGRRPLVARASSLTAAVLVRQAVGAHASMLAAVVLAAAVVRGGAQGGGRRGRSVVVAMLMLALVAVALVAVALVVVALGVVALVAVAKGVVAKGVVVITPCRVWAGRGRLVARLLPWLSVPRG